MDDSTTQKRKRILLAIVRDQKGRVLIIKKTRAEEADKGQKLLWIFPGGEAQDTSVAETLLPKEVLEKAGCIVEVVQKISQRDYPKPFVHLEYYECRITRLSSTLVENTQKVEQIKWVDPKVIKKFFTTDIDPGVAEYLDIK